jgi:catechol 2,3-dioxygenase-like lactoylglutathione lyase family enzyme
MTRIITILLLTSAGLSAQESGDLELSFDHVALSVADAERSAVFYERLFGLRRITDREPIEGVRWLSMAGGGELHLLAVVDGTVEVNQAVHLAVRTPDLDRLLRLIEAMGVEYTTWLGTGPGVTERDDGTRQLYLKDPDGYWVEVIGTVD